MEIFLHHDDLPDTIAFTGPVAIDTETMGLNHHRDRLCLVQLSFGNGICHLVKFSAKSTYDCPKLKALLTDPQIEKIFHFARFDIGVLKTYLNIDCTPIFCTKIASRLVRTYTDKHGLKDLCRELLGIELSKQQQSSDWGADELSKDQLAYAASDVLYLHQLKDKLETLLNRENRFLIAKKLFSFLPVRAELDYLGWEDQDLFSHS